MISGIQFNPYINQKPPIDPQILIQLQSLGLKPTGSREGDLAAIQQAKSGNTDSANNTDQANKASTLMASQTQQGHKGGAPWSSIMDELGIKGSGSAAGDAANISAIIATMQPNEASSIASRCQAVGLSVSVQNAQSIDPYAGQNQVAEMNKFFLLK
ncbi:MAG: hypothetical protein WCG23_00225 [bacterium]